MTSKKPNPYREMDLSEGDDHPLDVIARSQIPQTLNDDISIATKKLMSVLGENCHLWIELEALVNKYRQKREEVIFNIGYEHGFMESGTKAVWRRHGQPQDGAHFALAGEIRKVIVLSQLSSNQRISVLMETALGLMREDNSE
jgi:hypothetical protein